jgi:anti-sigma regulatory factor (Ser/Thr protein kinase)
MAELTLRIDLSELAALAAFVERFAAEESLPAEDAFQLNLVLEELITNTVSYGHPDGSGPPIQLRMERRGDVVEAHLVDAGIAFDPRNAPEPDLDAPLEERRTGGLGVFLVRQFVDELDYRREDGRNHLRLRKRVGARAASDGDAERT